MTLSLSLAVAILMGGQTEPQPYPLRDVHAAFEKACGNLGHLSRAEESLIANGWITVTPDAASKLGQVVAFLGKESARLFAAEGGTAQPPLTFERVVSGRKLSLMIQAVTLDGGQVNGCRLWDFEAARPENIRALVDLAKPKPTRVVNQDGLMLVAWSGDANAGTGETQYVFISKDHQAAKLAGTSGLSFKTSAIRIAN